MDGSQNWLLAKGCDPRGRGLPWCSSYFKKFFGEVPNVKKMGHRPRSDFTFTFFGSSGAAAKNFYFYFLLEMKMAEEKEISNLAAALAVAVAFLMLAFWQSIKHGWLL